MSPGNHFRLHKHIVTPGVDPQRLDPRGGALPSPPSLGLGIGYVHFRVKPGTAAKIGQFYREIFRAEVEDIGAKECSALGFGENEGHGAGVLVRTGPTQHIGFFESEDIPEYDGHHFCMYLSDEGVLSFRMCSHAPVPWMTCITVLGGVIAAVIYPNESHQTVALPLLVESCRLHHTRDELSQNQLACPMERRLAQVFIGASRRLTVEDLCSSARDVSNAWQTTSSRR